MNKPDKTIHDDPNTENMVDATFLKDDEHVKKIAKLQEILYYLEDDNFLESVGKIVGIGFTSSLMTIDLARNLIHLSRFHKKKIPLFVRLVSELSQMSDIVNQIKLQFDRKASKKAQNFLLSLIDANIIDSSFKSRITLHSHSHETDLRKVIEEDDIDKLEEIASSPDFDIDDVHFFRLPKLVQSHKNLVLTLVEFAAICGSVKCFRFLYINNVFMQIDGKMNMDTFESKGPVRSALTLGIIHFAIMGGSNEIMAILEQSKIQPNRLCTRYAMSFHRKEIFDWLVEQFPDSPSYYHLDCLRNGFFNGIKYLEKVDPQDAFDASCAGGMVSIAKLLLSNFSLRGEIALHEACSNGHIDIVKLLISNFSINVNKMIV